MSVNDVNALANLKSMQNDQQKKVEAEDKTRQKSEINSVFNAEEQVPQENENVVFESRVVYSEDGTKFTYSVPVDAETGEVIERNPEPSKEPIKARLTDKTLSENFKELDEGLQQLGPIMRALCKPIGRGLIMLGRLSEKFDRKTLELSAKMGAELSTGASLGATAGLVAGETVGSAIKNKQNTEEN